MANAKLNKPRTRYASIDTAPGADGCSKLILIAIIFVFPLFMQAQTNTVRDYGKYIEFQYASGDTVSVGKLNITHIINRRGNILLFTSHTPDQSTKIPNQWLVFDPDDFGYSAASSFQRYLSTIIFGAYQEIYSYENGNLDTVSYYQGSDIQYQVVYGYTGAVVTSKTIVTQ